MSDPQGPPATPDEPGGTSESAAPGSSEAPIPPAPHAQPGAPHAQPGGMVAAAPTNSLAIAAFVLSLVWIFWLGSLAGVILGFVALSQIKTKGERGRGLAVAGIVLGFLGLAVIPVFFAFVVFVGEQVEEGFCAVEEELNAELEDFEFSDNC